MEYYDAYYEDGYGAEQVRIQTTKEGMSVRIRNVSFEGWNFNCLSPRYQEAFLHNIFDLEEDGGDFVLANYRMGMKIPIRYEEQGGDRIGILELSVKFEKGMSDPVFYDGGWRSEEGMRIALSQYGIVGMEVVLSKLKQALHPIGMKIRTCMTCRYSHYWYAGSDSFGDLHCFKACKADSSKIKDKGSLHRFWKYSEPVFETDYCDEFAEIRDVDWNCK